MMNVNQDYRTPASLSLENHPVSLEQTLALIGFVLAMTGTPGPNNVILMATGANCGFRSSVPHLCGIAVGSQLLLLAIALGIGEVLMRWPQGMLVLRVSGSLFLLYMAVQMVKPGRATESVEQGGRLPSEMDESGATEARPMSFPQAVLFQWISPKSWLMCITAVATFTDPAHFRSSMLVVAVAFLVLGSLATGAWSAGGMMLKTWLRQGQRLVRFNQVMAAVLLISLYPLLS